MPGLVRKVAVVAAVESLVLYPAGHHNKKSLQIKYVTHELSPIVSHLPPNTSSSVEIYGIVGLLTVAPVSYLVGILGRQQVAQVRGYPVFVVTEVVLIPLSSQLDAEKGILQAKASLEKRSQERKSLDLGSDMSDEEVVYNESVRVPGSQSGEMNSPIGSDSSPRQNCSDARVACSEESSSNVAEDVIGRKGQYGRFAERWFSNKGWRTDKRRLQGLSIDNDQRPEPVSVHGEEPRAFVGKYVAGENSSGSKIVDQRITPNDASRKSQPPEISTHKVAITLMPKFLKTIRTLLESRSFFFSYDLDITRRLGTQEPKISELPLHKSVDPLYFWNRQLAMPLIEGGHNSFILPLMQGFFGQAAFIPQKNTVDSFKAYSVTSKFSQSMSEKRNNTQIEQHRSGYLVTLISRRSVKRPGLRYLRRGVDDEGNSANSVETEQVLSKASWAASERVYSFTQIRGSIPLFFSQSPYSFKPVPLLQHSLEMNQLALRRHFQHLTWRYGNIQIVLLVDKKGGEAEIGRKYEENIINVNCEGGIAGEKLGFEWFDFHTVCRGMKFENVKLLIDTLESKLEGFGETIETRGVVEKRQSGVVRTSCMDCLDRTNVVQSVCGQRVLENELREEGFEVDLSIDPTTQWFNTLWADNGDAVSRQYSSTAALKGDYTRTRQRNYRGAINDLGLTLSRYYNNIVSDYFSQAAIDYVLGNVSGQIFDEFEATLEIKDPAMSMAKVRSNAIDASSKIVIVDQNEDLVDGWTLLSPYKPDTIRTFPFEECIVLLTDTAIYRVRFDWAVEKVASFERVKLRSIEGITKGAYITSTLAAAQTDSEKNVGFVIQYRGSEDDISRVNTQALSSPVGLNSNNASSAEEIPGKKYEAVSSLKVLAFKALPAHNSSTSMKDQEIHGMSEKDLVTSICGEIQRVALGSHSGVSGFIEDKEIISVEQARRSTGLLEQWSHSLKKIVWA